MGAESLKSQHMGIRQVAYMDVVTNAGAVFGCIICSEDRHMVTFARCGLKDDWNQVRLGIVKFARSSVRPGGIEVPQA